MIYNDTLCVCLFQQFIVFLLSLSVLEMTHVAFLRYKKAKLIKIRKTKWI